MSFQHFALGLGRNQGWGTLGDMTSQKNTGFLIVGCEIVVVVNVRASCLELS